MKRCRSTRLEIDLSAIAGNVRFLRERTPQTAKLLAVVKADAYGHGAVPVAKTALANGAEFLAVAIPEEGVALREAGIEAPILVLGGVDHAGAQADVEYGLTQAVYDVRTVAELEAEARAQNREALAHLKIDTGMSRIGVRTPDEMEKVEIALNAAPMVKLTGAFTHFATADWDDLSFTREQYARFAALTVALKIQHPQMLLHCDNSAALLRCPEYAHDMVRAGIALYEDPRFPDGVSRGLREAMRWVTAAVMVKTIEEGDTVGYSRAFEASQPVRVMTVPVGYADGYPRALGNKAFALVRGQRVPVIGRVCMDQAMLDVSAVPGAAAGDEVVLLGAQGDDCISVRELAQWMDVIDYEAMLSPTARVPKEYI